MLLDLLESLLHRLFVELLVAVSLGHARLLRLALKVEEGRNIVRSVVLCVAKEVNKLLINFLLVGKHLRRVILQILVRSATPRLVNLRSFAAQIQDVINSLLNDSALDGVHAQNKLHQVA